MTKTPTLLTMGLAALLALSTDAIAQDRHTVGSTARHTRSAANRPQLPLPFRGGAPANDDCTNAETIDLVLLTACGTSSVTGDNGGSSVSSDVPSCDASDGGITDVWYTFNSGTNNTVYITLTPGETMMDYGLAAYDGCGGTELECAVVPGGAVTLMVEPGTDYLIQVYSNLDWGVGGEFTLCVAYDDSPIPSNDQCSSVTPEALAIGGSLTFSGTSAGATIDGDFVSNDGMVPAVWHGITLGTCATVVMDFCGTTPPATDGYGILSPACPLDGATAIFFSSANATTCTDGNFTITFLNVPAGTYYIPVRSEIGVAYGEYTLHVTAQPCIDPPVNDDCANAIEVYPMTTCDPVEGTTMMATESMAATACSGYTGSADDDVWYRFVANNTTLTVSTTSAFDGVLAVYGGSCASLQPLGCIDAVLSGGEETVPLEGLIVNNTYYYRIYSYASALPADASFTTCVTGPEGTSISEHTNAVNWTVFPNPGNGLLNITYKGENDRITLEVIDLSGRAVHNEVRYMANGQTTALDLNNRLAVGAYTVRLTNSTGRSTQRVVVE